MAETNNQNSGQMGEELKNAVKLPNAQEFAETFERVSSVAREVNNLFGQSRQRIVELKTELVDSLPGIARLGGNIGDVGESIQQIALASRRNVVENSEDVEKLFAASKVLGASVGEISDAFLNVGVGIEQVGKQLEDSVNYVRSIGGNTKQVMDSVRANMDQMNRYQFEGGVQGLTKMAAQASMLRFDMGETFRLADKVLTPEGAIETAAAFQRLGVSAGALADPFALMNQSINDPQGLQDSLVDVAKQFN
jgi:methyl-accepting chemotaxis protein